MHGRRGLGQVFDQLPHLIRQGVFVANLVCECGQLALARKSKMPEQINALLECGVSSESVDIYTHVLQDAVLPIDKRHLGFGGDRVGKSLVNHVR